MSLTLLQGYSSPEEEEEQDFSLSESSDEEDYKKSSNNNNNNKPLIPNTPLFDPSDPSSKSSSLPSAFDVFSQITGPPKFLNTCADAVAARVASENEGQRWRQRHRKIRKEKTGLPTGAVVEAKAQLVGLHERVRSDAESGLPQESGVKQNDSLSTTQGVKRVATATNPNAEDAAELLRMCLQCGVPKTFSNAQGMVCPLCGDRPFTETDKESKKKSSAIKDKEKSKRMKGQSSHATWKSETEMQLRQQFD
ncbi:Endoplasmic reticulum vesicle transporter protein [Heracleum sosnowskyi]|uniref:Endoplasmic reticulum vesicle transporter protein n=1 Tax=Heracleum sosnowskyi TaxID=360622 RepID=A0AAD8IKD6_9APIA|nr:Endoplasmic reticulum vesicle transporter protein [Heracleum sosnowskyi]